MLVLADVFMQLSYINEKKRFGETFATQLHCLFIYHTFFTSMPIDLPEKKQRATKTL